MKATILRGPKDIVLEEVPVPEIFDDEALVEVKYCGICGSDVAAYRGYSFVEPGAYLGHEYSGVICKVGKDVKAWKPGDRVIANCIYTCSKCCGDCYGCQHGRHSICDHAFDLVGAPGTGGFAKFVRVPIADRKLYSIPEGVSFEEGALVDCLTDSLHAVRISGLRARERAMVLGAGPIGLGVVAHLKNAGAGLIIATEVNVRRIEMAKKLGADYVFNPQKVSNLKKEVLELTNGKGVDVVFDCSGIPQVFRTATDFLRKGGTLLLQGIIPQETPILPVNFTLNEWQLQGCNGYYADEPPMVMEFLKKRVSPVKEMITSKIKLGNIVKEGFEVLVRPDNNQIKVLVEPEE